MRAHYFQHVPFEGLGRIGPWLQEQGFEVTGTRFHERCVLPKPEELDLLVIMGGPMSVNDEDTLPWLAEEKRFIREIIESGKPVLGICLGAQLIASSLGARVYPNPVKEIGWFPVEAVFSEGDSGFRFPASTMVFHWHGETFDLPKGAVRLARSEGCLNQSFQVGRRVMGLQFHLETTPESAKALVIHARNELIPGAFVQSEEDLLSVGLERYEEINGLMGRILDYLVVEAD